MANLVLADKFSALRAELLQATRTVDSQLNQSALVKLASRELELATMFAGTNAGIARGSNPYEKTNKIKDSKIQPLHEDQEAIDMSSITDNVIRIKMVRDLLVDIQSRYTMESLAECGDVNLDGSRESLAFDFLWNYQSSRQSLKAASLRLGQELGSIRDKRKSEK